MTKVKVSPNSYKVGDKWVASGVLLVNQGAIDRDIKLGPEGIFDSKEEANRYVPILAQKRLLTGRGGGSKIRSARAERKTSFGFAQDQ